MSHLENARSLLASANKDLIKGHYEAIPGGVCSALYLVGKAMAEEDAAPADVMQCMLSAEAILREVARVADFGRRAGEAAERASAWGEKNSGSAFFTSALKQNRRR